MSRERCYMLRDGTGEAIACGKYFGEKATLNGFPVDANYACFVIDYVYKSNFPAPDTVDFEFMRDAKGNIVMWNLQSVQHCVKEHHCQAIIANSDVIDFIDSSDAQLQSNNSNMSSTQSDDTTRKNKSVWNMEDPFDSEKLCQSLKSPYWTMVKDSLTRTTFNCPNCLQTKLHSQTPGNIQHHLEHCSSHKRLEHSSVGIQSFFGQYILGREIKDFMREQIALIPFVCNVSDQILRDDHFQHVFSRLNLTVPCIETAEEIVVSKVHERLEQVLPKSDNGFYSLSLDGWTKHICTASFVAIYFYHMSLDFKLTKILVDFSILKKHLDSEMICTLFHKYNAYDYGQLVGFCSDHASENMSATRLLGTTNFGCLFHKLHLVVGGITEFHNDLIKWLIELMSYMHSSYDRLCFIINETGESPVRFGNTRWCSLYQVIMYFLANICEICSFCVKETLLFINDEEIKTLEELALLLEVVNDVISDLLHMDFISVAFYMPTMELIKTNVELIEVKHTAGFKAKMIKDLTVVDYHNDLKIATALDIRFKDTVHQYPTDIIITAMDAICNYFSFRFTSCFTTGCSSAPNLKDERQIMGKIK